MKKIKSILVFSLVFILSFTAIISNSTQAADNIVDISEAAIKYNFRIVENNDNRITAKAEYEGQELYATLDKSTSVYTMTSYHKPYSLFGLGRSNVTEYIVDVEEISNNYQNVSAVIRDTTTGKSFKLEKSTFDSKVKAQIPVLIPILTWAGSSLLAWLASHAASITIAGVTAYALTTVWDKIKNDKNKKEYYTAFLDDNKTDVYIGPAIKNKKDAEKYIKSENSENINVFAISKTLARGLAESSGKVPTYIHHSNSHHGEGYYPHYHPVDSAVLYGSGSSSYYGNKVNRNNHIWYVA